MSPFKLNLIIYIFNLNFDGLSAAIHQQLFKKIKNCSLSNSVQANDVVIEEISLASLTECSSKCIDSLQCGVVMFDKPNGICYLVDKDYQVCDETIGIYEMVSYTFFNIM